MTNEHPLISVIVPVYNVEKYLRRCLDSIVNQTYKNLEIILVDDGSVDNSGNICDEYAVKDKRIQVIHKENGGVSKARNIAMNIMSGKYVIFIDADDWIEKDCIEELVNAAIMHNVELVRYNYYVNYTSNDNLVTNEKKYFEQKNVSIRERKYFNQIIEYIIAGKINAYSVLLLVRTEVIHKYNIFFQEDVHLMEDVLFYIDLFTHITSFIYVDIPMYHYFQNSEGACLSKQNYDRNLYETFMVNKKIKEKLLKNNFNIEEQVKILDTRYISLITEYIYRYISINTEKYIIFEKMKQITANPFFVEMWSNFDSNLISFKLSLPARMLYNRRYNSVYFFYLLKKTIKNFLK